jgi:multisubunit Na+/H+ antiporter MnhB subunit
VLNVATLKNNILCILALIVMMIFVFAFGFLFQFLGDPTMGVIIGLMIGGPLAILIAYYDKIQQRKKKHKEKTILEQQTTVICPRCKILVDINPGICPQCNQKV